MSWLPWLPGVSEISAGGFVGERLADVFDGAADGVLAVERALRAAQHFDAADVDQVEQGALGPRVIDVVEVEADAGIDAPQRVGLADAAQEDGEGGRLAAAGVDREIGHRGLDVGKVGRGLVFERFGGDHGDRHRHFLNVFLAAAGGDGDLFGPAFGDNLFVLGNRFWSGGFRRRREPGPGRGMLPQASAAGGGQHGRAGEPCGAADSRGDRR